MASENLLTLLLRLKVALKPTLHSLPNRSKPTAPRQVLQPDPRRVVRRHRLAKDARKAPSSHLVADAAAYFLQASRATQRDGSFVDGPLPTGTFPSPHAIVCAEVLL